MTKKVEYSISKEECQRRINELGNVCDRCGRKIKPLKTVNNSGHPTYWSGCYHGSKGENAWGYFTEGAKKEIFDLAEKLVCEGEIYYKGEKHECKDNLGRRLSWFQSQVSGFCDLLMAIEYLKNNKPKKTKKQFLNDKYF